MKRTANNKEQRLAKKPRANQPSDETGKPQLAKPQQQPRGNPKHDNDYDDCNSMTQQQKGRRDRTIQQTNFQMWKVGCQTSRHSSTAAAATSINQNNQTGAAAPAPTAAVTAPATTGSHELAPATTTAKDKPPPNGIEETGIPPNAASSNETLRPAPADSTQPLSDNNQPNSEILAATAATGPSSNDKSSTPFQIWKDATESANSVGKTTLEQQIDLASRLWGESSRTEGETGRLSSSSAVQ